jgi:hypothetical protein
MNSRDMDISSGGPLSNSHPELSCGGWLIENLQVCLLFKKMCIVFLLVCFFHSFIV